MYNLNFNIRRIFPVVCLAFMLFAMPSCRYIRQKLHFGKYSLKEAIEWAKQDSARVADSLKRVHPDKKVMERTMTDSVKRVLADKKSFEKTLTDSLISLDKKKPHKEDSGSHYYIIIGTFTNSENAKQAVGQFSKHGYKPSVIHRTKKDGSSSELVSVKTFTDLSQAVTFLKELQATSVPDAYIYTGK